LTGTIAAIIERFTADATLTATFPNGIWLDEMPERNTGAADVDMETNGPFVILIDGGATLEYCSESSYREIRPITFLVFAIGAAATELAASKIRPVFKLYNTITNNVTWNKFELTQDGPLRIRPEPTKSGKRVFWFQMDYAVEREHDTATWG